ncbi:hypothetical protein Lcho_1152 [Leptothrix cholodnii SP-6]|uniref:Uncharacterized protein n=1 Tax=Leptothrix cholodnii (strain ATCC 51168 / LMG 8142 / SP-6) TaxID=395495 RepID=B1Y4I2_LEPCP|nr:hypothetical protein Lcho_1152 [Leptothrix cholodnii SP-6]
MPKRFQSTPASFPASDFLAPVMSISLAMFQSTPASFPASDLNASNDSTDNGKFQSTPASFPASDQHEASYGRPQPSFNPRPPVSRRATSSSVPSCCASDVSIHARQFPGERLLVSGGTECVTMFQSTPASFPASDAMGGAGCPAPLRFNPRPPVSRRATRTGAGQVAVVGVVSIHARQFPGERLPSKLGINRLDTFQSTPASFPASDDSEPVTQATCASFQSTPASFPASDVLASVVQMAITGFNPRPPVSRRATLYCQPGSPRLHVSIHARQFPGERLAHRHRLIDHMRVSIHARQFPGERP